MKRITKMSKKIFSGILTTAMVFTLLAGIPAKETSLVQAASAGIEEESAEEQQPTEPENTEKESEPTVPETTERESESTAPLPVPDPPQAVPEDPELADAPVERQRIDNPRKNGFVVTWDCIYFGNYPQSDATGQMKEPIKWRVLSVEGNDAFLVADSNLDVQRYNQTKTRITWETCTMRSWLNGYGSSSNVCGVDYTGSNFIDRAFSEEEKNAIMTTTVVTEDNFLTGGAEGGNNTQDKVFLLSYGEVTNPVYGFSADRSEWDNARKRKNTAYVAAGGTIGLNRMNSVGSSDWWWLRASGRDTDHVLIVYEMGNTNVHGSEVENSYGNAVCPALHLDLSYTNLWSNAGTVSCYPEPEQSPVIHTHTYDDGVVTSAPTCETAGEKAYSCTVCKETQTEDIPATGHQYDTGVVTVEPTYTEKGIKTYTCQVCKETKIEEIPELPELPYVAVTDVKLSGTSKKIAVGKKLKLSVEVLPVNATEKTITWTSSNSEYATVSDDGVVTTKKKGAGKSVTITAATADGKQADYKFKILKDSVKAIQLEAKSKTLKPGKKLSIKATVKTTGKTADKTLEWSSSNTKYATVSKKGVVTAKKEGKGKTVTITAKAVDGTGKKATIKIKIK